MRSRALHNRLAGPYLRIRHAFSRIAPRRPESGFRMLVLHDVRREESGALEALLDYLAAEHGFLSAQQAAHGLLTGTRGVARPTPFLMTFDDGFASAYTVVRAILRRRRVKALFFVCPGLIEEAGPGGGESRLSWKECARLLEEGHEIGSHTTLHKRLSTLTAEEERTAEIAGSAQLIEERLGIRPQWFAYPYGNVASIDAASMALIKRTYRFCCSAIRGVNSWTTSPYGLYREHVLLDDSPPLQKAAAGGALDWLYRRSRGRLRELAAVAPEAA